MALNTSFIVAPGIRLMQGLRMPTKLLLMALLLSVPLVLLLASQYRGLSRQVSVAQAQHDGARWVGALSGLVAELQTHRGLTNRVLSGDATATSGRDTSRERLRAAVREVEAQASRTQTFAVPKDWAGLRDATLATAAGNHPAAREAAFAHHVELVERSRRLAVTAASRSGLLLDDGPTTAPLVNVLVERMVPWTETIGIVRGQGAGLLARGSATGVERAQLTGRADAIRRYADDMAFRLNMLQEAGAKLPAAWSAARAAAEKFADQARDTFNVEAPAGDAAAFFEAGSAALLALAALQGEATSTINTELEARAAAQQRWLTIGASAVAFGAALLVWLGWAFYASFTHSLRLLQKGIDSMAAGDLSQKLVLPGKDEFAQIATLVERMNERLSAMVAEIRSSAARVGMAGRQSSEHSTALAERTEEQAISLRQTLATVRALSSAVTSNASAASELDRLTGSLRTDAEAGGKAMGDTVQAMGQLEGSSRRVADIVSVIDGIAFQTNILALNAAVEAARAGESGRGFAVVAAEVRQLAQRSAAAAREIRGLIQQSTEQVGGSVKGIQHVGRILESLVSGVRTASDSLRSIASASAQQSSDLEQVTQAVVTLDEITHRNAEMVAVSSTASHDLVARAQSLVAAVGSMRLRQGSADEAQVLVNKALGLVHRIGLQAAGAELHSSAAGFVDRDLYIFVIDRAGHYVVHGAKPAMEGKRVHDVPGIDGDRFLRDGWAAADAGSGWIDYDIVTPDTGAVTPKTSFIVALDAKLFLGCGVYRRTESAPAAAKPAAAPAAAAAPARQRAVA